METSQTIAWKCDIFAYVFMLIRFTESMSKILQIQTSFTDAWGSTELNKAQASFTLVHLHLETWGLRGRE